VIISKKVVESVDKAWKWSIIDDVITTPRTHTVETDGLQETVKMSIRNEDLPAVFMALRNLYSNRILAVLREYSTNAFDAHVEAGWASRPIEVTMPSVFDSTLRIRDYGVGLPWDDVRNIYSCYGASTKRNTNSQVGSLGFGSKSGWTYADSFTITSYYNGTKTIYEAYIDNSEVGEISQLLSEPTDEENGVEIAIKVKTQDINTFAREAKALYKRWLPRPIIKNSHDVVNYLDSVSDVVLLSGKGWSFYKAHDRWANNRHVVMMGNIPYPLDLSIFDRYSPKEKWVFELHEMDLVINAEIGDVEFVPSREALKYTTKTLTYLKAKIHDIYAQMAKDLSDKIATAKNLYEARAMLTTVNGNFGFIQVNPVYQGKKLDNIYVPSDVYEKHHVVLKTYNSKARLIAGGSIRPSDNPLILIDRGDFKDNALSRRINYAKFTNTGRVYCVVTAKNIVDQNGVSRVDPDADIDGFLTDPEMIGADTLELNTLVLPKIERTKNADGSSYNPKAKYKVFKFNNNITSVKSESWDEAEIDENDDIVYLEIYGYKPVNSRIDNLETIRSIQNYYNELFGSDLVVYGVRQGSTIPENAVTLESHVHSKIATLIKDQAISDLLRDDVLRSATPNFYFILANCKALLDQLNDGVLKSFLTDLKNLQTLSLNDKSKLHSIKNIISYTGFHLNAYSKDQHLERIAKIKETFSMMDMIEYHIYRIDQYAKSIAIYVNGVETLLTTNAEIA